MAKYTIEWDNRYDKEFLSKVKDGDSVMYLNTRSGETGEVICNLEQVWIDSVDRPQELRGFKPDSYTYMVFDISQDKPIEE